MDRRPELQMRLEEILGTKNVYYNPPESIKMQYDAIRYSRKSIQTRFANNALYNTKPCYELVLITRRPDSPIIQQLMALPYCSYDRHYYSDNLHHDVFTLYY